MVINYKIKGTCGKNKNDTIIYNPKRLIYAYFVSFMQYGKPSDVKKIYKALKTLIKTPNVLKGYDAHYSSIKTNCILALSNTILIKEYNANYFVHMRLGISRSIPNTYFATNNKDVISYSICLKNGVPTKSSQKAARNGYVVQLLFDSLDNYYVELTDPSNENPVTIEQIIQIEKENRAKILQSIINDANHKYKYVNDVKVDYLEYKSEDVEFEYGLSNEYISINEKELDNNEIFENGIYVKVLKFFNKEF